MPLLTSCTTGGRTSRIWFPGSTWERETEALPQGARCESNEMGNVSIDNGRVPVCGRANNNASADALASLTEYI
jgi:hypothetical protein